MFQFICCRMYNQSCEEDLSVQRGPTLCCTLDNVPLIRSVTLFINFHTAFEDGIELVNLNRLLLNECGCPLVYFPAKNKGASFINLQFSAVCRGFSQEMIFLWLLLDVNTSSMRFSCHTCLCFNSFASAVWKDCCEIC